MERAHLSRQGQAKKGLVVAFCLVLLAIVPAAVDGAFESDELEWEGEDVPLLLPRDLPTAAARVQDGVTQDQAQANARQSGGGSSDKSLTFDLEHSLDGVSFTKAGEFSAKLRAVPGQVRRSAAPVGEGRFVHSSCL
jgi:hypothetical protein